ncbi:MULTISPECIES: baseplate multidomain protein megatron [Mesorhizobium]|uniref:Host specificity protein n=1 Tax=Mesorhizobium denitrificans TaxID=2294114 RepID=A0A371XHR0_9HYPH|nr:MULTISPECIES: glycoside hydrolase/phage tail family protein [Mesorhizobium]RFC68751.1 host specificity protein [Mesorhizobium denitrificans]
MATIILQAAGAFIGGYLGAAGAAIGSAAGAIGGYLIDRALLGGTKTVEGARLDGARPFTAEEGASLPRVYGAARVGGTLIWATRFEEVKQTKRQGGKGGGQKVSEYSYFGNAAFALCEGPIAGVRRVWADGQEIDLTKVEMRVYRGTENQLADPLIEVKQGSSNTPAYRGVAYVVLERFPLEAYGNRLPQFNFEVLRTVGDIEQDIRAVTLIPGSTEYGLATVPVKLERRPGETEIVNRHVLHAATDLEASLNELQALCPNVKHVAIVVSWYGNDLRAGNCLIRPAVVSSNAADYSMSWKVCGVTRTAAIEVSRHSGNAAFGGSPCDASVVQAIASLKARGIKVTLYPFVMMDIPAANSLPDPYGGAKQQVYPWRGRITSTADRTSTARTQINTFCGTVSRSNFSVSGSSVTYSGATSDWGYRRFILHCANLAKAAGGVDAFLIGSELRGLTRLRDGAGAFPFVEQLCKLAADVRLVLGSTTKLTYGADWSEYFGYRPADGSGDVLNNLDALWAHPAIDAVGIDNYMPLSDWRDGDEYGGHPDGVAGPYDPAGLRASIAGGEGFDWYYASSADRAARARTQISDGAYGKPWVYRYKDLIAWWANTHRNRAGGVEAATATAWVPQSKPIWFTEIGCPAIDKGCNQPNVFYDPKSDESALPYFSSGGRCDFAQKQFLKAHLEHWNPGASGFQSAWNPVSSVYGGRMLDHERIYVWSWDARPFPAYPLRSDVWADGGLWQLGHWLNGRAESVSVGALINAILTDHGLPKADVSLVSGTVQGYLVSDATTARNSIESLVDVFRLDVWEGADSLVFADASAAVSATEIADLVLDEERAVVESTRMPDFELPAEMVIAYRDPLLDYQSSTARQRRPGASGSSQEVVSFQGSLDGGQAAGLLERRINDLWSDRETIAFAVPAATVGADPGARVRLEALGESAEFVVQQVEDGLTRQIVARPARPFTPTGWVPELPSISVPALVAGKPLVLMLDLPMMPGATNAADQFRIGAWQKPWASQIVYSSPETTGYEQRATVTQPANAGRLLAALGQGFAGRFDRSAVIEVELFDGEAASASRLQVLNGANAVAVLSANGQWEIIQYEAAEEIAPNHWRFSSLLRGQLGTDDASAVGAEVGANAVLLDSAVLAAGLKAGEVGLALNWRVGPTGADFSDETMTTVNATGGVRALLPLAPVHLRCVKTAGGDLALDWVRCSRIDADDWDASDVPLGEESERYLLQILNGAGATVREAEVSSAGWGYAAALAAADFPSATSFTVRVRQIGTGGRFGLARTKIFPLN